jgi:hypothetical protein
MWLLIALLSAYAATLVAYPILAWKRPARDIALLLLGTVIAASPLWIPSTKPFGRLLATLNAVALLVKLYDFHVGDRGAKRPSFRAFLAFLPNFHSVVWRRLDAEPSPTQRENLGALAWGAATVALALGPCIWAFVHDWSGTPFLLEHIAKTGTFYAALIPLSACSTALWRLGGMKAREFMAAPLLAATPAEFWRRYNRPAQQFFYENVFKPCGGIHAPLRATLATFVVSAIVHEYVFGMILGRVEGYQTWFFLLQGLGVMATLRVRPTGARRGLWWAATLAFNLVTSVFFFASVNGMVPFYSRPLPWPLAGW